MGRWDFDQFYMRLYIDYTVKTITVYFMLLKITEKVLLDCNIMYNFIIYCIHGYCYCSLLLLLFIVYTIIVYCYCAITVTVLSQ